MNDVMGDVGSAVNRVRIERQGAIGYLVLSQPATLNALTLDMLKALQAGLQALEADAVVKLIIIRSDSARAFCAGGDMKHIRQLCLDENFDAIGRYFTTEYALNLAIARCSKPYLALIDGIAMGGGLGISVNGRFRIVTERALLAMPETRIGFFPDVGASHFLPRLPARCGYWLGLTSASVRGIHAVQSGLATHHVASSDISQLLELLQNALQHEPVTGADAETTVAQCLATLAVPLQTDDNDGFAALIKARAAWFADDDIEAIRKRLQAADSDDAGHLLSLLNSASPNSLRITRDLFRRASGLDLAACLQLEYATAQVACRHPDLVEGVRAVLVDKDKNPSWLG